MSSIQRNSTDMKRSKSFSSSFSGNNKSIKKLKNRTKSFTYGSTFSQIADLYWDTPILPSTPKKYTRKTRKSRFRKPEDIYSAPWKLPQEEEEVTMMNLSKLMLFAERRKGDGLTVQIEEDTGIVLSASLRDCLLRLLKMEDERYNNTFFLSSAYFISNVNLLQMFIIFYRIPPEEEPEVKDQIRSNILNLIQSWLEIQTSVLKMDFKWINLFYMFINYLKNEIERNSAEDALLLESFWFKQISANSPFICNISCNNDIPSKLNITEIPPQLLAEQITIKEHYYFLNIRMHEYYRLAWSKKNNNKLAPNLLANINRFNKISYWVASTVLQDIEISQKERAGIITHWIRVMNALKEMNNFNSAFQIYTGLYIKPVEKLSRVWKMISKSDKESFDAFAGLINLNYKKYREMIAKVMEMNIAYVPMTSVILKDLSMIEEMSDLTDEGDINMVKFYIMGKVFNMINSVTKLSYSPLSAIQDIQNFLENPPHLTDTELYDRSNTISDPNQDKMNFLKRSTTRPNLIPRKFTLMLTEPSVSNEQPAMTKRTLTAFPSFESLDPDGNTSDEAHSSNHSSEEKLSSKRTSKNFLRRKTSLGVMNKRPSSTLLKSGSYLSTKSPSKDSSDNSANSTPTPKRANPSPCTELIDTSNGVPLSKTKSLIARTKSGSPSLPKLLDSSTSKAFSQNSSPQFPKLNFKKEKVPKPSKHTTSNDKIENIMLPRTPTGRRSNCKLNDSTALSDAPLSEARRLNLSGDGRLNGIQYTISETAPIVLDKQVLSKKKSFFKKNNNNVMLQQEGLKIKQTYKIPKSFGVMDQDPNKSTPFYNHFKIYLRSSHEVHYLSVYRSIQKYEKNPENNSTIYEKICIKYLGLGDYPAVIKLDKSTLKKISIYRTLPQPAVLKPLKAYCLRQLEGNYYKFKKSFQ